MGRDDSKLKRSDRDKELNGERHKGKDRDRYREKSADDKHKERHKDRDLKYKEKEKEKERARRSREDDNRERVKEKVKEKGRERDREKDREWERERENEERERVRTEEREEREREREKERERKRIREKEDTEREKERLREREEREKERERKRIREKEDTEREERESEREREREREKRRELDRDDDSDGRGHDRKRRRREDEYRERERERGRSRSDRHKEDGEDVRKGKHVEGSDNKKETRSREEEMEEEQKKLDEEMDKRRRRVQEWQELKRKEEEQTNLEEPKSGKAWNLDFESDDDEAAPIVKTDDDMDTEEDANVPDVQCQDAMMVNSNKRLEFVTQNGGENVIVEDDIDPLDAFMNSMVLPEIEKFENVESNSEKKFGPKKDLKDAQLNGTHPRKSINKSMGRIIPGEDSDSDDTDQEGEEVSIEDEDDDEFMKRVKKTKVEKLQVVDHSKMDYPPFRKNFYIEVKEISRMTSEEVAAYRRQLELVLKGKDKPKPIKTWIQTGLTSKILDLIKKFGFDKPMPIQAQALPIIMRGRDCIGVAKTGSGKTLAFVLPMLRHIKDQPPVVSGDGPVGLIMAPTRELVQQIHSDIKKFAKAMGVRCVPVYGGSGVAQQISDLKRGCEIVVCTPGRMIDILCTSSGKITNLRRVTYLVMDEADRMFDMGFEPQITRIVQNTRPDRQTVLFSATFPRQVEILARKVLTNPLEIQIGGRSVVNKDIAQLVEVRPESEKFLRTLELLGEWSEKGKILIFVQSQDKVDALFKDFMKHGYPCLSLHGGKEQTDRESTISDYKSNVCNLMVATSIASRGLDVKELELVINYDVPNHYEDYVHRVGRTGRAGRRGWAITFITEEDAKYAPDLVKALELSEQAVPADLKALADGFMEKVSQGLEQAHGTGYGGSGYKFNEEEDDVMKAVKKAQAREYGFEEDKSGSDSDDEGIRKAGADFSEQEHAARAAESMLPGTGLANEAVARAAALAAAMNLKHNLAKIQADAMVEHYEAEFEINDFPQNARWKVTHKETLGPISERSGASITIRGQHCPPGKLPGPGERKLYLFIEGPTESSVRYAKADVKIVLEDIMRQSYSLPGASQPNKYSVL